MTVALIVAVILFLVAAYLSRAVLGTLALCLGLAAFAVAFLLDTAIKT